MNAREEIKILHGLGYPLYKGQHPNSYTLNINQALPRTARDLAFYAEAVRWLDHWATQSPALTWHVNRQGKRVYLVIDEEWVDKYLFDLKADALAHIGRTARNLHRYRNRRGETFRVGRNGLLQREG